MARRMRRRLLVVGAVLPLGLWAASPLVSEGASPSGKAASLQQRIEAVRDKIERKRGTERVLASDIAAYTQRINRLQADISTLRARQVRLQADLDAKRAELVRIQERLRQERARLARLRARLVEARTLLARRLVEIYKADDPDVMTVLLNSDGFADLLERSEFMSRVSDQDARIINLVRDAKAEATATAARLDRLEARQQALMLAVLARRDEVARNRQALVDKRVGYDHTRQGKVAAINATREDRRRLEDHVHGLEAEQAKVLAALQAASRGTPGGGSPVAGPIRRGAAGLIWPVNGAVSSGFGQRWGRLHAGVDIPAATGTPIRAAASGRVVLMGWTGGYGNYTCIQHTGSMSTCYAHQSAYRTSNGAQVSQGQVIGAVGNTGHSFGAHLHFEVRIGGSPVDPMGYL